MKDMALIWWYFVWGGVVGRSNSYYGLKTNTCSCYIRAGNNIHVIAYKCTHKHLKSKFIAHNFEQNYLIHLI